MEYHKLLDEAQYYGMNEYHRFNFYKIEGGVVYWYHGKWSRSDITTIRYLMDKCINLDIQTGRGYPTLQYFLKQGCTLERGDIATDPFGYKSRVINSLLGLWKQPISSCASERYVYDTNGRYNLAELAKQEYYENKESKKVADYTHKQKLKGVGRVVKTREGKDVELLKFRINNSGEKVYACMSVDTYKLRWIGEESLASYGEDVKVSVTPPDTESFKTTTFGLDLKVYEPFVIEPWTMFTGITNEEEYSNTFRALVKLGIKVGEGADYKKFIAYPVLCTIGSNETYHDSDNIDIDYTVHFQQVIDEANKLGG